LFVATNLFRIPVSLQMSNVTPKRKQSLCSCLLYILCSTIAFKKFIITAEHKKIIQINFKYLLLQQDVKSPPIFPQVL